MTLAELKGEIEDIEKAMAIHKINLVLVDAKGNVWEPTGHLYLHLGVQAGALDIKRRK